MKEFLERISNLSPKRLALLAVELQTKLESLEKAKNEPVAIVGMSCRFPGGANSPQEFWNLLRDGVDAVTEVPASRWDVDAYYSPDEDEAGKMSTRSGGFLDQVDLFDPHFFGIAPREAVGMDPQQRLLLEVAWEALENAGQSPDELMGSRTGVFVGMCAGDYYQLQLGAGYQAIDAYLASGSAHSVASGRLSYILGLQGPSLSVDTACSSSLVAIHLAVQSLRNHECQMALAGGANLILSPETTIALSRAHMMAPDGRCKTFDSRADGFVRSEGCGVLVLKRLSDAQAAGDNILAVIRGSAINQDGRSNGLTAPNGPSQESVIADALANAGVSPAQISFVETHGTGTSLGDPIEVQALSAVLGEGRAEQQPVILGAVKTNIGHAEGAAGVAGVIKLVLALQNRQIPPHLHLQERNPFIPWDELPVTIPQTLTDWQPIDGRRLAGVSSFGFSGTNVHMILEEAPAAEPRTIENERPLHVFTLSARDEPAFRDLSARYARALAENNLPVGDLCYTANAGRAHFSHRLALTGTSAEQLQGKLLAVMNGEEVAGAFYGHVTSTRRPKIAFLFTGQGSQYADMGRQLYDTEPVFRSALDRCDALLRPYLERPLLSVLYPAPGEETPLDDTAYTQPALFAIEYALAELWASWGVKPSVVMGHSVGEYVAACVAGVFSLEDGLKLIAERGRLMSALPKDGAMAAIFAPQEQVAAALAPYARTVSIAAVNGQENIVISGRAADVQAILDHFKAEGVKSRALNVSHAFHSPLMTPILDAFERVAQSVTYAAPRISLISNVTGGQADVTSAAYWRDHIAQAVQFAPAMQTLYEQGYSLFVEIGPSPTLLGMGRRCLPDDYGVWLPSLREKHDNWTVMLESLSMLYVSGVNVDWKGFDKGYPRRPLPLPTYPFQRQRYWASNAVPRAQANGAVGSVEAVPASRVDQLFYEVAWPLLDQRAADHLLPPASIAGPVAARVGQISTENGLDSYNDLLPHLDALCAAYIILAFQKLGWAFHPGQPFSQDDVMARLKIQTRHDRLVGRMLDILREDGYLAEANGRWQTVDALPEPDPEALWATLMAQYPDFDAELGLTARCARQLAEVLRGQADPLQLLFPGGSLAETEKLYQNSPPSRTYNTLIQEAVGELTARLPQGQALRVLEIGAGTGGTTSYLLPILPADQTDYTFTDVSPLFTQKAAQKFAAYPFVSYEVLNIEDDVAQQGFPLHHYDMIVASNVLHATSDLRHTLSHVRDLLAPDGVLIIMEGTAPQRYGDLTVGLTEGWWSFTDHDLRPDYALLPRHKWLNLLAEIGCTDVQAVPGDDAQGVLTQQSVFIARGPRPEAPAADQPMNGQHWLLLADADGIGQQLAERIQAAGGSSTLVLPSDVSEQNGIEPVLNSAAFSGVVNLWPLHVTTSEAMTIEGLKQAQLEVTGGTLLLAQALARQGNPPPLWLVTRGGQAVITQAVPDVDPVQSSVWGLSHVIAMEHPELKCKRVDLDPAADVEGSTASLFAELLKAASPEDQIAYRHGSRRARRLVRMTPAAVEPARFAGDATYLITGGLSGLGLLVAQWMVERGACHLALMGRSAPTDEAQATLRALETSGANILVARGDVSQYEDVAHVLAEIEANMPPLRGVIHSAGALDDGVLLSQTWPRFETALKAKVYGTWHLHTQTRHLPLDFFVMFSSGASLLGSPGQSNHAAANAFMDTLAYYRWASGLPSVAINWGAWAAVGAAAKRNLDDVLDTIDPEDGLLALERALYHGLRGSGTFPHAQVAVLPTEWDRVIDPAQPTPPLYAELLRGVRRGEAQSPKAQAQESGSPQLLSQLENTLPNKRLPLLRDHVRARAVKVLGLDPSFNLSVQQPLQELGLDSLMAVELRNVLGSSIQQTLPSTVIFDYPTVDALTNYLASRIPLEWAARPQEDLFKPEPAASSDDAFDDLSDDDLAALLMQKLDIKDKR